MPAMPEMPAMPAMRNGSVAKQKRLYL